MKTGGSQADQDMGQKISGQRYTETSNFTIIVLTYVCQVSYAIVPCHMTPSVIVLHWKKAGHCDLSLFLDEFDVHLVALIRRLLTKCGHQWRDVDSIVWQITVYYLCLLQYSYGPPRLIGFEPLQESVTNSHTQVWQLGNIQFDWSHFGRWDYGGQCLVQERLCFIRPQGGRALW